MSLISFASNVKSVMFSLVIGAAAIAVTAAHAQSIPKIERDFAKQPSGDYILDRAHASVTWRVMHMGLAGYTARFDKMDGTLNFTPATASASRVEFSIEAPSINTGLVPFNKKLMEPEWFDGTKNPGIKFKSTRIESVGDNKYKMTGDMTLRGVTKPMTWDVTFNGGLYNSFAQAHAIGFSARGVVKRSDWGMKELAGVVGEDVEVQVEVEFIHRPVVS
jgi:polyisoprenoid-binding protein YceI